MDDRRFWALIDECRAAAGGDVATQCRLLEDRLAELAPEEIRAWDAHFAAWDRALELEKLWAAAFLFGDGCSDDGFQYFKRWVMAQGREATVAAMADPDSLAELLAGHREVPEAEGLSAAWEAYRRATGEPLAPAVLAAIDAPAVADWDDGFDFEEDMEETARRLPRIAALTRG